ncbi:CBS domain-containing protein, partial [Patescibacteria group bacterium]
ILYKEELKTLLQMGVKEKQFEKYESDLIKRSLRFNNLTVKQVMTPLKKAVILDGDTQISKVAYFVSNSAYSRFPVFLKREDNIIGSVHIKQIFATTKSDNRDDAISTITNPVEIVPDSMMIDALFHRMRKHRFRLNLVKNSKNKLVGLVTMRDLVEEIIGDYPEPAEATTNNKSVNKTSTTTSHGK